MTEKRFTIEIIEDKDVFIKQKGAKHFLGINGYVNGGMIVDLLNEQHETIQVLEKCNDATENVNDAYSKENEELHQIQQELVDENRLLKKEFSKFTDDCIEYRMKVKETLQKRYKHLLKSQGEINNPSRLWQGAIMEVEVIANCLGVDLE